MRVETVEEIRSWLERAGELAGIRIHVTRIGQ